VTEDRRRAQLTSCKETGIPFEIDGIHVLKIGHLRIVYGDACDEDEL